MLRRPVVAVVALVALMLAPAACGPDIDIQKSLTITDVISGYYDNGLKDGWNHLLPSITFRIANSAPESLTGLELTVAYWQDGKDGEMDSVLVQRVGNDTIPANGKSDPVTVRGTVGYRLEEARADLFQHSLFLDVTAKIFARRGGRIYPIGSVKLDHTILPHVRSGRP
ncbi:MAG TPA: hypothetical protein VJN96_19575 [Vicinamibacterales bacterium]|nr:hypothetical protein [Vicinamibacterales bacterium]